MRRVVPFFLAILLPAMASAETLCFRLEDPNNTSLGYIDVKLEMQPSCQVTTPATAPRLSFVPGSLEGYDEFGGEAEGWLLAGTCRGDEDKVLLNAQEVGGSNTLEIFGDSLDTATAYYLIFARPVVPTSCSNLDP